MSGRDDIIASCVAMDIVIEIDLNGNFLFTHACKTTRIVKNERPQYDKFTIKIRPALSSLFTLCLHSSASARIDDYFVSGCHIADEKLYIETVLGLFYTAVGPISKDSTITILTTFIFVIYLQSGAHVRELMLSDFTNDKLRLSREMLIQAVHFNFPACAQYMRVRCAPLFEQLEVFKNN